MTIEPSRSTEFRQTATLKNGTPATIRVVLPGDRARLIKAFSELDPETTYTRFFSFKKALTEEDLAKVSSTDFVNYVSLAVTVEVAGEELIIGVGSYSAHDTADGVRTAEVAFTIEEDYQGQGLAGSLLRTLIGLARQNGVARFEAEVLSKNAPMIVVFERSGLPMTTTREEGVIHVVMDLAVN